MEEKDVFGWKRRRRMREEIELLKLKVLRWKRKGTGVRKVTGAHVRRLRKIEDLSRPRRTDEKSPDVV